MSAYHNFCEATGWQSSRGFAIQDYLDVVFEEGHPPRFFSARDFVRHDVGVWQAASRRRDNVFFVRYSDMVKDAARTVTKLAEFIGVELTPTETDAVVEKSSFAYMKDNAEKFRQPPNGVESSGVAQVRQGKVGESRATLSESQARHVDERMQEMFHDADPRFPYEEIYLMNGGDPLQRK